MPLKRPDVCTTSAQGIGIELLFCPASLVVQQIPNSPFRLGDVPCAAEYIQDTENIYASNCGKRKWQSLDGLQARNINLASEIN